MHRKDPKKSGNSQKEKKFGERSEGNGVEGIGGNRNRRPDSVPSFGEREPTDVRDNDAYQFIPHGVAESGDSSLRKDEARTILVELLARYALSLDRIDDCTEAA